MVISMWKTLLFCNNKLCFLGACDTASRQNETCRCLRFESRYLFYLRVLDNLNFQKMSLWWCEFFLQSRFDHWLKIKNCVKPVWLLYQFLPCNVRDETMLASRQVRPVRLLGTGTVGTELLGHFHCFSVPCVFTPFLLHKCFIFLW